MPDAPDPDPLTKVIGALRAGVDELARLAEHPTVKSVLGGLIGALSRDEAPAPAEHPPAPAPAAPSAPAPAPAPARAAARRRTSPRARTAPRAAKPVAAATAPSPGGRRAELLTMIAERPGLSIPQAAKHLGIAPNGLYGVARKLEAEGLIRKDGTGWHPAR